MRELRKIMLVEDEQDIQVVARMALEEVGGFSVEVCSSGTEAVERAIDFVPDFILLDVMMPEMDGPTTFTELRKESRLNQIPIAFMTAKVQPHEVAQLVELGAVGVIAKPFKPLELSDKVRALYSQAVATAPA